MKENVREIIRIIMFATNFMQKKSGNGKNGMFKTPRQKATDNCKIAVLMTIRFRFKSKCLNSFCSYSNINPCTLT